jgi:hypothetical protein
MRYFIVVCIATLLSLVSCRKDFDTISSPGKLDFSKTTVYLDTVFKNIGSSTYTLKVYNNSNNDITIPSIALNKGAASKYRLMVDGLTGVDGDDADKIGDGKLFPNVELLAKDSMFIFIETTIDIKDVNSTDMLYTDEIVFNGKTSLEQKVNLVTLVKDAIFLYPEKFSDGSIEDLILVDKMPEIKIKGFELSANDPINGNELRFTNQKPYVIYGYAGVPKNRTLIIDKGARVFFHAESGIFVKDGGSIQVNGEASTKPDLLENEVIFEGDRLEPDFAETPGQWGIIYLAEGSSNNRFNHLTIKNATVGIFVDRQNASTVQIKNTQIYNASNFGIIARQGKVNGENIVINKAGQSSLACILGGTYNFKHCTFANYWSLGSRQTPSVYLDNTYTEREILFVADLVEANFTNCIIYGTNNIEVGFNKQNDALFNYKISNCLIKFNDVNGQLTNNPLYAFAVNPASKSNIISNGPNSNDPKFKDGAKNNLRIGANSTARAKGDPLFLVTTDADGKTRTTVPAPDLGAYEHALVDF